jgi:hypothetical protein
VKDTATRKHADQANGPTGPHDAGHARKVSMDRAPRRIIGIRTRLVPLLRMGWTSRIICLAHTRIETFHAGNHATDGGDTQQEHRFQVLEDHGKPPAMHKRKPAACRKSASARRMERSEALTYLVNRFINRATTKSLSVV